MRYRRSRALGAGSLEGDAQRSGVGVDRYARARQYTGIARGKDDDAGVALVEVFQVQ